MVGGKLDGKVAWISGAGTGIGRATAELFAREGAAVTLIGRRGKLVRAVTDDITRAGGRAMAMACDAASESQVKRSIQRTIKVFGGLDIIINNAGMVDVRPLHLCTVAQWDHVMDVNLKSMFLSFKHGLEAMKKRQRGWVVNLGSISSFVGQASTPAYTTSKHAILGLTRSIALDYAADGIRCNCLCPGITDTPMLREHMRSDAAIARRVRRVPMGVALTPHDVAKSVLFLACDDSSGITGTSLVIDCGYITAAEWQHPGKTAFMGQP